MKNSLSLAGALLALLASCKPEVPPTEPSTAVETAPTSVLQLDAPKLAAANLGYAVAGPGRLAQAIPCYGEVVVDPSRHTPILPRIAGVIVEVRKHLGDPVEEGEVVAVLESQALAIAVIEYARSEEELDYARLEFERETELFSKKLSSAEVHLAKQQALRRAQIDHAAALQPLAVLQLSEERLHQLMEAPGEADASMLEVRSPLTGVVTHCGTARGEPVTATTELHRISDLSEVLIDFQVPLESAASLEVGQKILVRSAFGSEPGEATLRFISPMADERSRRVAVRASLPNAEGTWRPGTPVTTEVLVAEHEVPVAIPAGGLLDYQGGFLVFVRTDEGRFEARSVTAGDRSEELVEITHGVAAGESVVTRNAFQLKAEWAISAE